MKQRALRLVLVLVLVPRKWLRFLAAAWAARLWLPRQRQSHSSWLWPWTWRKRVLRKQLLLLLLQQLLLLLLLLSLQALR